MSVIVVYVPDTGHVVGALSATGAAPPATVTLPDGSAGPLDPTGLVGTALPVRVPVTSGNLATIPLAAKDLAAHSADDEPGVFVDPLAFVVQTGVGGAPKPKLESPKSLITTTNKNPVALTTTTITITVPTPNTTDDTPVLVYIADGQTILTPTDKIRKNDTSVTVTLPTTLVSGTYGVLALVPGWAGFLDSLKIP